MSKVVSHKDVQKNMILNENLWKVMYKLSWPAVIAMVLYGLNALFDAIFVGQFVGETALAGVSFAYPLSQITLGLGSLIGVGAGSALSIALGANDKKTQKSLIGNVNYLSIVFTLVYMIASWILTEPLVKVMGGSGDSLALGSAYFRVTIMGSFFWIHGLATNMVVRAEGKMKSAALMMGTGLVVNIVANYVLIVMLGLGVEGAAWGTNLGMLVYTVASMIYFKSGYATFDVRPFAIKRNKEIVKSIFSMGVPSLIMTVMSLIQALVVFNALASYGTTTDVAFYGASYRVFTFLLTPIFGLMRALQPCIGINYGAGKYERVIKSFKVFAFSSGVLMFPFWLLLLIVPQTVLSMMLPGMIFSNANLLNFRVFMSLLPMMPVIFMAMTFFPAIGNGKPSAIMGIVRQVVFYIPVMLIMPRLYGVHWVYWGSMFIDILMSIWVFYMVKNEFAKLRKSNDEAVKVVASY